MPMNTTVRNLLQTLYNEAEGEPGQLTTRRVNAFGREYKIRIELANPDYEPGTILILLLPRPVLP